VVRSTNGVGGGEYGTNGSGRDGDGADGPDPVVDVVEDPPVHATTARVIAVRTLTSRMRRNGMGAAAV
jgi:hypothetical protein